jgi:hypothetical protein
LNNSYGYFIVSDRGYSLSSINNPALNINNPMSPINNVVDVPEPSTIGLFGLASIFLLRLKKKNI